MATPIGFQSGIEAAKARMKRLDPGGFNTQGTGAWDKFFKTVAILVTDHDAVLKPTPPPVEPPPTQPPPTPQTLNPQTYNKGSRGQDARYCVTKNDGYRYDADGRELDGRRSGKDVPGLKPSDEMDSRGPCDPYGSFPPWPKESYEV